MAMLVYFGNFKTLCHRMTYKKDEYEIWRYVGSRSRDSVRVKARGKP